MRVRDSTKSISENYMWAQCYFFWYYDKVRKYDLILAYIYSILSAKYLSIEQ